MKSEQIDWSKAPEWATGYGFLQGGFGIEAVWFNEEQYLPLLSRGGYGPYPFGGGIGPHMHNASMGQIQFQQHKPGAWSGEGLPPVGVVCEAFFQGQEQGVVEVRYSGECMVLWNIRFAHEQCSASENYRFEPIRTPEQIAAEERELAIKEMIEAAHRQGQPFVTKREMAERLYNAGYRKPKPGAQ